MVKPWPQAVPRWDEIVPRRQQGAKESIPLMEPEANSDYISIEQE
jgi:hypothetical protein